MKIKIIKYILILFNLIIIYKLYNICITNHDFYNNLYDKLTNKYVYIDNAPRGKILDVNGNILVDNKGINNLVFNMIGVSKEDILYNIEMINKYIKIDNIKVNENILNNYKEYSNKEIINEKEAYIYYLMNNGTYYQNKIIKRNMSDEELTIINNMNLKGINIEINYERIYLYDTCLNQLFGKIGNITSDIKEYYKNKNISNTDIVGTSYLELYYNDYLMGEKSKYKVTDTGLELVNNYIPGKDLILNIDIDIQIKLENKVKNEILEARKYPSSKYFNSSYIVLSNTKGNIISLVGLKYINNSFKYDAIGLINNSYTVGSVVKGATQALAYNMHVLDDNNKVVDSCIKLYSMKEKCSWKSLGLIDDIDALTYSSNYYQFLNVFKVLNKAYSYNSKLNVSDYDFNLYRDYLKTFGLGSTTGIDLYNESTGIKGNKISGDLLLNLSIGQYDTYTPLMLNQYIATIANNGSRYKLNLVKQENKIINEIELENKYMSKIQNAFNKVMIEGTAKNYINIVSSAGKTGTSETYINNIPTITRSIVTYFPYEEPIYALSIVSPNIYYDNNYSTYSYPINRNLTKFITELLYS